MQGKLQLKQATGLCGAERSKLNKPGENRRQIWNGGHSTGPLAWSAHTHVHAQLSKTFLAQLGKSSMVQLLDDIRELLLISPGVTPIIMVL